MAIILGIESTAHTFGVGVVKDGKILANVKSTYTTKAGGIIPMESAKHHHKHRYEIYSEALNEAKIKERDIDAIAFSQGPGLAPCLLEGMRFAKELSERLSNSATHPDHHPKLTAHSRSQINNVNNSKIPQEMLERDKCISQINLPLIPVNHCIAHLEIGRLTKAKDPVMLYVSGANTQIIAYAAGRYRIFGETLDIGVGNFIDNFARLIGIGFPGGPKIQEIAERGKKYIELPYKVKGMDIALSGILTNLKQKIEKMNSASPPTHPTPNLPAYSRSQINNIDNKKRFLVNSSDIFRAQRGNPYTIEDLAFSMQETVFAMLVEVAERALAHTGKTELLLGGGVACNSRLQEMCKIMCKERGAKFFCPSNSLLTDNGAMIAFLGEVMFSKRIKSPRDDSGEPKDLEKIDIKPRERTDDVDVNWK
jgi:tRNA A37 threonylcarbamoyltransferase TsaD